MNNRQAAGGRQCLLIRCTGTVLQDKIGRSAKGTLTRKYFDYMPDIRYGFT